MKRILPALIISAMIVSLCPAAVFAEGEIQEPEQTKTTRVGGLLLEMTKPASSEIKDTVTVTPARERTVALQLYDAETKTWVTKKKFVTGKEEKEKVVIAYPKDWKKTNSSIWRLSIKAGNGGAAYTSKKIKIMTRNRKTLKLNAKSAIIMEKNSGQIFYGKGMDTPRANASTTKMMTAILALENKDWDSKVTFSKNAVKTPYTSLAYQVGDKAEMRHVLHAALILSDNGSATALAEHTAGSVRAFAEMMNEKAEDLGCENTHFVNPHGLDASGHYSTARDLATIGRYAMNNSKFRGIVKKKQYSFRTLGKKRSYSFKTTNKLLGETPGIAGIKTGTTGNADCCFVGAYRYGGKYYITVVLGSKKDAQRWEDTKTLIRYIKTYV